MFESRRVAVIFQTLHLFLQFPKDYIDIVSFIHGQGGFIVRAAAALDSTVLAVRKRQFGFMFVKGNVPVGAFE